MELFIQIVVGIIIAVIGFLLTTKSYWLTNNFGRIAWFEQHFGTSGGTQFFYKAVGILTILGGFLYATGMLQYLVGRLFAPSFEGIM